MKQIKIDLNALKVPIISFMIFIVIGLIVWAFRNIMYFYLFAGIGFLDFGTRLLINFFPKLRQFLRLSLQFIIGSFLLGWIGLAVGVNFQFPELFFDLYAGVVTGALIQFVIARLILPFFLGNAFCSRACWSGFFFEFINPEKNDKKKIAKRSNLLAWGYLIAIVCLSIYVAFYWNPGANIEIRKWWIIGENLFIITIGFVLTFFVGSRAYCRLLCPFLTVSGLISPYSIFKITPEFTSNCTHCNKCSNECPMLIDVHQYVMDNNRVNDPTCIVCERCISACNKNVLRLTTKSNQSK